jgi:hypothetical protein
MMRCVIDQVEVTNLADLLKYLRDMANKAGAVGDDQIAVTGPYCENLYVDLVRCNDKGKITYSIEIEEKDCLGRPKVSERD